MDGMRQLFRDVTYNLRQWRRNPGFAVAAVLTLAIGLGGVTAAFSIIEAVLLRPLPFSQPERLMLLHETVEPGPGDGVLGLPAPDVIRFQRENQVFAGVAGYIGAGYEFTGRGAPFRARAERVSASLLPVLGVQPLLGRNFTQEEDDHSIPVALISYGLWQERFQGDEHVLGRTVALDRRPYTIVGVMPREFAFPIEPGRLSQRDVWVPMSFTPLERADEGDNFDYNALARLRRGITPEEAKRNVDQIARSIQATYPPKYHLRIGVAMKPLKEEVVQQARPMLRVLMAAVVLVLLIGCVNLANLLLVRAIRRRREFGVRLALGANRRVLVRQLVTESLLLSGMGGVLGVALAVALVRGGRSLLPESLPRMNEIGTQWELGVHWPVLLLALLLMGATGLVCGLVPAIFSLRTDIVGALAGESNAAGRSRAQQRLRGVLVVAETGLAMVLLIGAGLLLRSFASMLQTEPGFAADHVLTAALELPREAYPSQERVDAFYRQLGERLRALPQVEAAGLSSNIPVVGQNSGRMFTPEGYVAGAGEGWRIASNYLLMGDYFQAMRIPLLAGRYFSPADDQPGAPLVGVISQSVARQYFAGRNPLGRHVHWGPEQATSMPQVEIVGVVGDVKQGAFDQATVPEMYEPLTQVDRSLGPIAQASLARSAMRIVVRAGGEPAALSESVRRTVRQMDPQLALTDVSTMDEVVSATEAPRRFNTVLVAAFAAVALLLALVGIYGVLAFSVSERTREIAVRMAVGAPRAAVVGMILRYGLVLTAVGALAGAAISVALARFLRSLLYGVTPFDGVSVAGAALLLLGCAALASLIPARRASGIEPVEALREQ